MTTRLLLFFQLILAALLLPGTALSDSGLPQPVLRVAVTEDIAEDYQRFIDDRLLEQIRFYGGEGARRDVIELVLLQQALSAGGFTGKIEIVREQTYRRTLHQLASGDLISSGALVWREDLLPLADNLYITQAIVEDGEFEVGLYTTADNTEVLARSPNSLHQLRIVTSPDWKTDQKTLENLGFEHILLTNTWLSMVRMLAAQRADLTLAPFQIGAEMAIKAEGITLIPVPGVKVKLQGSRHWAVSKAHPEGAAFFTALERGIVALDAAGIIDQAYRECGFFNTRIRHWPSLAVAADR